jgi:uncharacterized protein (TIGR02646 family)
MRPVDKGVAPHVYTNYSEALYDLRDIIEDFCSYCERQIETHLAVEHIQPKSRKKSLLNAWSNFLLCCVNCNSCKGKKSVVLDKFFWPDHDNTMRAFLYDPSGAVKIYPRLRKLNRERAQSTIALVGLDRIPGQPLKKKRPTRKDQRWLRRIQAFDLAHREQIRLQQEDTPIIRELIVEVAHGRGMFSIWMQVFSADQDMRERLRAAFVGTDAGSFDANQGLRRRAGGLV